MWNISKIPHSFISTWPTTSAASRNSVFKIGPKVHMRIISINSMRKSKKIPGRRLSIAPSSCAWVSCWFWIVMLHRSLGVLAATPFQVLIACAKDLICTNLSTRLVSQNFTDSWPFPTFEFNFDCEKHLQLRILSACQTSPWHNNFVIVWLFFVDDIFFSSLSSPSFLAP